MAAKTSGLLCGLITSTLLAGSLAGQQLAPRSAFPIPLVHMSIQKDEGSDEHKKVRITQGDNTTDHAIITRGNDFLVREVRNGTEKTQYVEDPDRAFVISKFEAEYIDRVVSSFRATLDIYEKDVARMRWDRCLHLDAYLPRFLKAFHYLVCAARNSTHAMPQSARVPDAEYEVSQNSTLSDRRVALWLDSPEYPVKLRIVAKELSYQLEKWQKKELQNPKRNFEVAYSSKAEEAYSLFIRVYFNLRPIPDVPQDGEHL